MTAKEKNSVIEGQVFSGLRLNKKIKEGDVIKYNLGLDSRIVNKIDDKKGTVELIYRHHESTRIFAQTATYDAKNNFLCAQSRDSDHIDFGNPRYKDLNNKLREVGQ